MAAACKLYGQTLRLWQKMKIRIRIIRIVRMLFMGAGQFRCELVLTNYIGRNLISIFVESAVDTPGRIAYTVFELVMTNYMETERLV